MIDERCTEPPMPSPIEHVRQLERKQLTSSSIDWYAEGETRVVEVDGVRVTIRFVGRKGRRARIAITAAAGAVFRGGES